MAEVGQPQRERWGTRIGVILAVAGSAVGLGNFLRFPGQAAQNGGGAFMLPYFIALLVLGIPLCWAEWTMGRYGGTKGFNSAPGVFTTIWRNRAAKYFGGVALLIPLVIYMYYVLIEAWCLSYAWFYLDGTLASPELQAGDGYAQFFGAFTGQTGDGEALARMSARDVEGPVAEMLRDSLFGGRNFLWVLLATFAFNFILIYRGVSKGIEVFCKFAMPTLVVLAVIVLIRVLTLGGANPETGQLHSVIEGLGFMWNPRGEALWEPETWLAASGQIFFSLSVGFGIIINYASYLREDDDVVLSGLSSSSMNEFFEVCLGGLITLPAAFIFLGLAAGQQGTFGLGFVALPNVFALMPAGQLFGFLWFFMLFVAAVTSSVSMLQPVIAFLEEGFGLKRHASAAILGLVSALGCGFVVYFSRNLVALDTFDFWIGSVLIFVLAMVQAILYGWVLGIGRGEEEAHRGAHIRIPRFVQYMLKFVVPLYLLAIFIGFCFQSLPSSDELKFSIDRKTWADGVAEHNLAETLREAFQANDASLPETLSVAAGDGDGEWVIRNRNTSLVAYVLREEGDQLKVFAHSPGYAEKIANDTAAFGSLLFIGSVLAFILLLIHIAGRRWEAEGRFDHLDQQPATSGKGEGI